MRLLGLFVVVGALAVVTAAAQAGPDDQGIAPIKVSMESVPGGLFTANGNVLCRSGQEATPFAAVSRMFPDGSAEYLVKKEFTCDDGSGTFEMLLIVHPGYAATGQRTNIFRWMVTGGTGAYAELEGFGTGFQDPRNVGFGWADLYNGRIGISR